MNQSKSQRWCVLALLVAACSTNPPESTDEKALESAQDDIQVMASRASLSGVGGTRIRAFGSFSCDFLLDFTQTTGPAGGFIERDRIFLQRYINEFTLPNDPGMLQKHIPFLSASETTAFIGGRYLFEGRIQAAQYENFIKNQFFYPAGVQFFDRPEFVDPECRDWTVLRAQRFEPLAGHTAMRTERFDTEQTSIFGELGLAAQIIARIGGILAEAESRGYAEVHFVQNLLEHKFQIVYFISRVDPPSPTAPDVGALTSIAGDPTLSGSLASDLGMTPVFDRSSLVMNIWLPYGVGDSGDAAIWPNSPPLPEPTCGDDVCIPSQGEDSVSCPNDCTPNCGDAICQADENLDICPGDCELPIVP